MCFSILKYGRIDCHNIEKESYHDFGTEDEAKEWGKNIYGNWAKEYPNYIKNIPRSGRVAEDWSTRDPLAYYCGNLYRNANDYYRSGDYGNGYFDSLKTELNNIINAAPRIPDNIVVYRALYKIDFWDFRALNRSRSPFVELGFMSTSLTASILTRKHEDPYSNFSASHYALRIYVPKGTKAVYVDEVGQYVESLARGELELLFPSETKLYMVAYPYRKWGKCVFDCQISI